MKYKKIDNKALELGLKSLEKSFGGEFAEKGLKESEYKAIPTGHDELDAILTRGSGGLFLGGICELYGGEGSGKSSLAMRAVGMAQELGLRCAWIDAEHSWSPDLARFNHCDSDKLVHISTTKGKGEDVALLNASEILDRVFRAVWSNLFSLIVFDSVAALITERMLSEGYDPNKKGMAEVARSLSEHLPRIAGACAEKECTVIFINQVRVQPGVTYGNPETTPGGRALKFYASQRISVSKGPSNTLIHNKIDGVEEVVGHYARVRVAKNRRNEPCFDRLDVPIYYREYFPDVADTLFKLARSLGVITTNKGIMTWTNENKERIARTDGESSMLNFVRAADEEDHDGREGLLAQHCVSVANGEKNKKKKKPVKVPSNIEKLASEYVPSKEKPKVDCDLDLG